MSEYQAFRVTYEIISALLCFILVWFMMKPYRFTRKGQYVGLPLAFGLLGASYLFSAIIYARPSFFSEDVLWFQLVARAFAFIFLGATYLFSKKQSETVQLIWKITFSIIVAAIITSVIAVIFLPQLNFDSYRTASSYVRIPIIISLIYVIIQTIKNHIAKPLPTTLLTPMGYILLAISQFSLIIWGAEESMIAWWESLALRWCALAIFLFVAYTTFYRSHKKEI